MWWNGQNLENPITEKDGVVWNFLLWHDHVNGVYIQRIFFWDTDKKETGAVEFKDADTLHISKLKQVKLKLAKESNYRAKHLLVLNFPIEKNYAVYEEIT